MPRVDCWCEEGLAGHRNLSHLGQSKGQTTCLTWEPRAEAGEVKYKLMFTVTPSEENCASELRIKRGNETRVSRG